MEYIAHRINTAEELANLKPCYGVEVDLRDDLSGAIYLEHDPFKLGMDFNLYLKQYHHGLMILNIKSERIELKALELLKKYGIEYFFFLDSSFPMIKLLCDKGENRIALRFSEYEGIDTIEAMAGKANWIWIDCFSKLPLDRVLAEHMKDMGYKLCLVSPELQGQPEKLKDYAMQIRNNSIPIDAICCKRHNFELWEKLLSM
jgi:hypothetical protein